MKGKEAGGRRGVSVCVCVQRESKREGRNQGLGVGGRNGGKMREIFLLGLD